MKMQENEKLQSTCKSMRKGKKKRKKKLKKKKIRKIYSKNHSLYFQKTIGGEFFHVGQTRTCTKEVE